jgi:hypothetical protein
MSAIGAMPAAPRIPNRKGDSAGASGTGGLKTYGTATAVPVLAKYMRDAKLKRGGSYKIDSLYEPVE